jgi:hypothetical protein
MAFGFTVLPREIVVAAGKSSQSAAPVVEQAQAILDMNKGDSAAVQRIFGSPPGFLVHVTFEGEELLREPFPAQRPEGIGLTSNGWQVLRARRSSPPHVRRRFARPDPFHGAALIVALTTPAISR